MTGPLLAMMVMTPMYTADAWALIAGIHTSCTQNILPHSIRKQFAVEN